MCSAQIFYPSWYNCIKLNIYNRKIYRRMLAIILLNLLLGLLLILLFMKKYLKKKWNDNHSVWAKIKHEWQETKNCDTFTDIFRVLRFQRIPRRRIRHFWVNEKPIPQTWSRDLRAPETNDWMHLNANPRQTVNLVICRPGVRRPGLQISVWCVRETLKEGSDEIRITWNWRKRKQRETDWWKFREQGNWQQWAERFERWWGKVSQEWREGKRFNDSVEDSWWGC